MNLSSRRFKFECGKHVHTSRCKYPHTTDTFRRILSRRKPTCQNSISVFTMLPSPLRLLVTEPRDCNEVNRGDSRRRDLVVLRRGREVKMLGVLLSPVPLLNDLRLCDFGILDAN